MIREWLSQLWYISSAPGDSECLWRTRGAGPGEVTCGNLSSICLARIAGHLKLSTDSRVLGQKRDTIILHGEPQMKVTEEAKSKNPSLLWTWKQGRRRLAQDYSPHLQTQPLLGPWQDDKQREGETQPTNRANGYAQPGNSLTASPWASRRQRKWANAQEDRTLVSYHLCTCQTLVLHSSEQLHSFYIWKQDSKRMGPALRLRG